MPHINLLRALPKTKRNIQKRAEGKDPAGIVTLAEFTPNSDRFASWRCSISNDLAGSGRGQKSLTSANVTMPSAPIKQLV